MKNLNQHLQRTNIYAWPINYRYNRYVYQVLIKSWSSMISVSQSKLYLEFSVDSMVDHPIYICIMQGNKEQKNIIESWSSMIDVRVNDKY